VSRRGSNEGVEEEKFANVTLSHSIQLNLDSIMIPAISKSTLLEHIHHDLPADANKVFLLVHQRHQATP
jgi:hypothetical protein